MSRKYFSLCLIILAVTAFSFTDPGHIYSPNELYSPPVSYSSNSDAVVANTPGYAGLAFYYPKNPIYIQGNTEDGIVRNCREFIDRNPEIFSISSDKLTTLKAVHRLDRWWIIFRQMNGGVPVLGGRVDFRIFGDGRLAFCSAKIFSEFDATTPLIGREGAIEIAKSSHAPNSHTTGENLVFWPEITKERTRARLAWQVDIREAIDKYWRCYISAITGEMLGKYSLINYYDVWGSGSIQFLPKYYDDSLETSPFEYGDLNLNYFRTGRTDGVGQFNISTMLGWDMPLKAYLTGAWVEVIDRGGENGVYETWLSPPAEHNFTFSPEWADTDEINLYFHTNYIHEYYEALDPPMTALDYPVPARAGIPGTPENAFWDGYGTNYGSGGMNTRNFALFSNIIYHEYTHGITGWIYEGTHFPYSDQPGAMNEAYSDYFACTNNDDPRVGYKCSTTGSQYFRTMDNSLRMPEDWFGEVHYDGRIMGGAFWELRGRVGANIADTLIHFTRYATPNTFDGFVPECIFTDDDDADLSNGTPHYFDILQSFDMHGIGPGIFPNIEIEYVMTDLGDGDGYLEPGEQLSIVPHIVADDGYAWPNILGLRAVMRLEGEWTAIPTDTVSTFDVSIAPGDSDVGDQFIIEARTGNIPHLATVYISFTAENSPLVVMDSFSLYVGHPQVLLVDDDANPYGRLLPYYTEKLDSLGITYIIHRTLSRGTPSDFDGFPAMLWFTGDDTMGVAISGEDTAAMADFQALNGNILLTGQRMTQQFAAGFLETHFGAEHSGIGGAVILDGLDYAPLSFADDVIMLIGATGANNQRPENMTHISPAGGQALFIYNTGDTAAIAFDNGINRTVLFGFGLEGVAGTASLQLVEILDRIMSWFGVQFVGVEEREFVPIKKSIARVSPNPFNAVCIITVEGSATSRIISAEFYDIEGRLVEKLDGGSIYSGRICWRPDYSVSSGLYFVRIITEAGTVSAKAVLLR